MWVSVPAVQVRFREKPTTLRSIVSVARLNRSLRRHQRECWGTVFTDVWLTVAPPDAVGRLINIREDGNETEDASIIHPDAMGRYVIGVISSAVEGIKFRIEALEVSGFRDEQVTLMLMDGRTAEQAEDDGGGIDDADPATVTILSGAETPTVYVLDR